MRIEKGKTYRIWLEGLKEICYLEPIESRYIIYPHTTNLRYTHYINGWYGNLNQVNVDYIDTCLAFDQPIAISDGNGGVKYVKIIKIEEFHKFFK